MEGEPLLHVNDSRVPWGRVVSPHDTLGEFGTNKVERRAVRPQNTPRPPKLDVVPAPHPSTILGIELEDVRSEEREYPNEGLEE